MSRVGAHPTPLEQDELDALIEEARRRAGQRRRRYGLALLAALLVGGGLYLGFFGGGGSDGGSTAQGGSGSGSQAGAGTQSATPSVFRQQFTRCPVSHGNEPPGLGNWGGSVAGMSCAHGAHVLTHLLTYPPHAPSQAEAIRKTSPSHFRRNGFDCQAFPLEDGYGWHLLCARRSAAVSFYFTP
jgi:hypothetical protein